MYKTRLMTVRQSQAIDHVQSRPSLLAERAHLSPQGRHHLVWPCLQRLVAVVERVCDGELRNSAKSHIKHTTLQTIKNAGINER